MPDAATLDKWLQLLNAAGVLAVLVLVLYGGLRKWWVYGWTYREAREDLRECKELLYASQGLADRAIQWRTGDRDRREL